MYRFTTSKQSERRIWYQRPWQQGARRDKGIAAADLVGTKTDGATPDADQTKLRPVPPTRGSASVALSPRPPMPRVTRAAAGSGRGGRTGASLEDSAHLDLSRAI